MASINKKRQDDRKLKSNDKSGGSKTASQNATLSLE